VFKPIFSLALVLIWGVLFGTVLATVWWTSGQPPSNGVRGGAGVLAGIAAYLLEAALARRHTRRNHPANPHRKTTA
jgi:uncharacterized membrane protein YedE/YeeE